MFAHSDRQWERDFLAGYSLDARLFERLGHRIKQIIPAKANFKLITDKGFFYLKKLRFTMEEMNFIIEAADHLQNSGFAEVFNIVKQADGEVFFNIDDDKYYMTEWVDGREGDYANLVDVGRAAEFLAGLHELSKGFAPSSCPSKRNYLGRWKGSLTEKLGEIKEVNATIQKKPDKTYFDEMYLSYSTLGIADAEEAICLFDDEAYTRLVEAAHQEKGFIHHDFGFHSLVNSFDGRLFISDFDFCAVDLRIHDLGSFIIKNLKRCEWEIDRALYIIDKYNSISPLKKDELKLLKPFILFPQDLWQLTRQCFIEKAGFDEEDCIDKMSRKSEHIDAKKKLINQLSSIL